MKSSNRTISHSFLSGLLIIVLIGFFASSCLLWLLQTRLSNRSAEELLKINTRDVQLKIQEASDKNLLALTRRIAKDLPNGVDTPFRQLTKLLRQYDASEINLINENGIIIASTYPDFMNYDMRSGEQSAEFLCLLDGEKEYVQSFRPVSYSNAISRKYAGVRLETGGFVQVGYNTDRFQQDIAQMMNGITHNWHVGRGGFVLVSDYAWNLVSDPFGNEGENLDISGLWIDVPTTPENRIFHETVYGIPCCCLFATSEGYYIVAVIPEDEIVLQRDTSVLLSSALEILVFIALFVMIFLLVKKLVVSNINRVNSSLSKITEGDLDEVVNVHNNVEFSALSDDINATVSTLKQYIAAAAARIDEELAFAKNIQQSALPSVFPPYPERKDFSLFASMDTAKEVGGDFYDFYLLNESTLAFLIADVSGKGIPAAMFMMAGKTLLRDHAERGDAPSEVFQNANDKLCDGNDAEMFITAWMGFLNTESGLVRFLNAGHNPPVLIRNGKASFIEQEENLILAVMEGIPYREQTLQLEPGDLLYLYTDGVTEASNAQEDMYGEERLLSILSKENGTGEEACRGVCRAVKEDINRFVGDAEQFDDITMLCLSYTGKAGESDG